MKTNPWWIHIYIYIYMYLSLSLSIAIWCPYNSWVAKKYGDPSLLTGNFSVDKISTKLGSLFFTGSPLSWHTFGMKFLLIITQFWVSKILRNWNTLKNAIAFCLTSYVSIGILKVALFFLFPLMWHHFSARFLRSHLWWWSIGKIGPHDGEDFRHSTQLFHEPQSSASGL